MLNPGRSAASAQYPRLPPSYFISFCYYAATQLALQAQQECSQVLCSNKEARKRLTKLNGIPAERAGASDSE